MRGIWEKRRVCGKISETGNKNCCYWQDSDRLIHKQRRAKVYTTDVVIEEQEFAESKRAAGEQAENAGYSDAGDGFMNIPDGVDGELPFM
jgi:hypothetical protein